MTSTQRLVDCSDCPQKINPERSRRCSDALCRAPMCSQCALKKKGLCGTGRHGESVESVHWKGDKTKQSSITKFMRAKK